MTLESLFAAASQKPSTERAAFLEQACGDDAQLRRQVDRLLAAHDAAGDFLEAPAPGATQDYSPTTNEPGQTIGPYKLLQLLGEGGMGTVWVAEQEQPVKRRVALKLIKAGMDSAQVLRRFEAERQALAMMDHTNIAKVLDAGTTPQGRPYFAMELVKGVPITKYCDELHLSLRERLDLFVPVCRAIQHAHQKGIIHRDIKPSNVLVAVQDGKPVPKVIDFGVAKAMQQRLTDQSMYTEIGAVIGTLEYMSPEQAELSALDIDTRTDVYALGVLLYELLTGSTPLDRKRLKQAAFAEMLRIIKEVEPPKPSTRLTESKDSLASLAAQRRTEPAKLSKAMRGELDWIVMKCLEKDRTRRYETANGLARDVERYLINEPVEAGPPSAGYRLRKLIRRNQKEVALFCVMLVGMGIPITGWVWKALKAQHAAKEAIAARDAEAEQRTYAELALVRERNAREQSRKLITVMTDDFISKLFQDSRGEVDKAFARKALDHYQAFAQKLGTNEVDRALAADIQHHVANVREFSLGDRDAAAINGYHDAIRLRLRLVADNPSDIIYRKQLATSYLCLGRLLAKQSNLGQAESAYRDAVNILQSLTTDQSADHSGMDILAGALHDLSVLLLTQGKSTEGQARFLQACAIEQQLVAAHPSNDFYLINLAESYTSLGNLSRHDGRLTESLAWYEKALPLLERVRDPLIRQTTRLSRLRDVHLNQAITWAQAGEYSKSAAIADEIAHSRVTGKVRYNLACVYALCMTAAKGKPELQDQFAKLAISQLRDAQKIDYFNTGNGLELLKSDRDLDSLRNHEDFKAFLTELNSATK